MSSPPLTPPSAQIEGLKARQAQDGDYQEVAALKQQIHDMRKKIQAKMDDGGEEEEEQEEQEEEAEEV